MRRRAVFLAGVSVFAIAFLARWLLAVSARHPGHGDFAFYYTVAENVANGRGFLIDYIWHYLNGLPEITHSSSDYWMPLTSAVISLFFRLLGPGLPSALLPSILLNLALVLPVYFFSKTYGGSRFVKLSACAIVLCLPLLFRFSLLTDSTVYSTFIVSFGLLFLIRARMNPRYFLAAAACAGLAHLTRQDGLLLLFTVLAICAFSRVPIRTRVAHALLSLGVYLVIVSPLVLDNLKTYQAPLAPGPAKTMFLTAYEDLYTYAKPLTLASYLEWGFLKILLSKAKVALGNADAVHLFLGEVLSVFALIGTCDLFLSRRRSPKWALCAPVFLYLALQYAFHTLIATFPSSEGGFLRSGMALIPFLLVIALDAIERFIPVRWARLVIVGLICPLFLGQGIYTARGAIASNHRLGQQLESVRQILDGEIPIGAARNDIVIMTRNPWEVYHSTRYRAIQIPNDDLETIVLVAKRYGADFLLLPAPRPALQGTYRETRPDPRFEFMSSVPNSDWKLFRIKLPA